MSTRHITYKKKRQRLYKKNPNCELCGRYTYLPETFMELYQVPVKENGSHILHKILKQNGRLEELATLDHIYNKFDPRRQEPNNTKERRLRLVCWSCNNKRGIEDHTEYLKRKGLV